MCIILWLIKEKFENIQKIATVQRDDYKTGCLLYYSYYKDIDLIKQQALNPNQKAIQQTILLEI